MDKNVANATIHEICSAFGDDEPASAGDIPKALVLTWMNSAHIEVRGCIYSMIAEAARAQHIKPTLEFEEYYAFVVPYLEQCIVEDRDEEWVESRYLAGHALVRWIRSFWESEEIPRDKIDEVKRRLGELYKAGSEGVRDALVHAVLEHLFEQSDLIKYFEDWKTDPILNRAYNEALAWKNGSPG